LSLARHPEKGKTVRSTAAQVITSVVNQHCSLASVLPPALEKLPPDQRALTQELVYGTLRWYPKLFAVLAQLIKKPFKRKDRDIESLLLIGFYQLIYLNIPPHAVLSQTVEAAVTFNKIWAKGVINGVLRQFSRQQEHLINTADKHESAQYAHPQWFINQIKQAWPDHWQSILHGNNERPPMTLRINQSQSNPVDVGLSFAKENISFTRAAINPMAITLEQPVGVDKIPGFNQGILSVQDGAAQLAATILAPQPNETILDLCAAPGGKTCHLLELQPSIALSAVDNDTERLKRVQQNLDRLHLTANIICGDASEVESWWDGVFYDRILLDAPCSATGVIRRHPDIKLLRTEADIERLQAIQRSILASAWKILKQGGTLLYATCSILPQENQQQIARFLAVQNDAELLPLDVAWGIDSGYGRQIFPSTNGMDGFFYALLRKN
jgi:16S rRNA (cytosine967-C5)-methyltransferase